MATISVNRVAILLLISNTIFNGSDRFVDAGLQSVVSNVEAAYFASITVSEKVNLNLVITWIVSSIQDIDGLIVGMGDSNSSSNGTFLSHKCTAPNEQYWIRKSNTTDIGNGSVCTEHSTLQRCQDLKNVDSQDLCEEYIGKQGFYSISRNQRNATFRVPFRKPSVFKIAAYQRQNVSELTTVKIPPAFDCVGLVMNQSFSYRNAAKICLKNKIPGRKPQNFGYVAFDYYYDSRITTGIYTWLSPLVTEGLVGFQLSSTYLWSDLDINLVENDIGKNVICFDNNEKCLLLVEKKLDRNLSMWIENEKVFAQKLDVHWPLLPALVFVTIKSVYEDYECLGLECVKTFFFQTPDIHCEPTFNYCDEKAACIPFEMDNENITDCKCPEGYRGNGVNSSEVGELDFGDFGCTPIDLCITQPDICHESAICESTDSGPQCRCPPINIGDGFRKGTGCRNVILPAVLSVVLVIMLVVSFIVGYRVYIYFHLHRWPIHAEATSVVFEVPQIEGEHQPTFGERWELKRDTVLIEDQLGNGNQGVVYKGRLETAGENVTVAVKLLNANHQEEENVHNFLTEISFMLNIGHHHNIVEVLGCCTSLRPVMLVTEFMKYGDLLHFLVGVREEENSPLRILSEQILRGMALDVAKGLNFLSNAKIIHGDIAARNVLVGENFVCKISDFGLANDVYRYGLIKTQMEKCIPFRWVSPERLMEGKAPITTKSDVWSFGNLLYEIVTLGKEPYPDINFENMLSFIKEGHRMAQPPTCSNHLYSVMTQCWRFRPYLRPRTSDLVKMLTTRLPTVQSSNVVYVNVNV